MVWAIEKDSSCGATGQIALFVDYVLGRPSRFRKQMPPQEDTTIPEIRKVKERLLATMGKDLAERKMLVKDLLVQNHPDRNQSPQAKEVLD